MMVAYLSLTAGTFSNNTPCCMGTCTCCTGGNQIVLVIDRSWVDVFRPSPYDIDAALQSIKRMAAAIRLSCWMEELLAIPRRMKRPFPRALPGPKLCHAILRPIRRNWMRYRRLWRHAKRDWF
jgi:hypothetical protein